MVSQRKKRRKKQWTCRNLHLPCNFTHFLSIVLFLKSLFKYVSFETRSCRHYPKGVLIIVNKKALLNLVELLDLVDFAVLEFTEIENTFQNVFLLFLCFIFYFSVVVALKKTTLAVCFTALPPISAHLESSKIN